MKIFLSYARENKMEIKSLYSRLKASGFTPWMDTEDILPGQEWETCIKDAIRTSDAFLVLLTDHSVNKRGVIQKEIRVALDMQEEKLDGDIYIVPVRVTECDIPPKLSKYQCADLFEENGWDKLVATLESQYTLLYGPIASEPESDFTASIDEQAVLVDGDSFALRGKYPITASDKISPLKLRISRQSLGEYVKRGQSVAIAQFLEVIAKDLKNVRYVFQGIKRFPFAKGDSDSTTLVYAWRPRYDAVWEGSRFTGTPKHISPPSDAVFQVIVTVSNDKSQHDETTGEIVHWEWVKEDKWLREAPAGWDERYIELVWRRK